MEKTPSTPKDVFQHLLMIVTLYVSVFSIIALLFHYANILLPDELNYYFPGALDGIRWNSSMLLIIFPIFILMSWLIQKEFKKEPEKHQMRVRKWLVYLTLLIASITIAVDLVQLVYNFYSGELTAQFVLKVLVVLVVAGAVFGYYLWDLQEKALKSSAHKTVAWLAGAAVLISIIAGFFIVGSPAKQRQIRFDEERTSHLQMLQNEVVNYWSQKNTLPPTLDDLKNSISGFTPPVDPETGAGYTYKITSKLSFELCADFKQPSLDRKFGLTEPGRSEPTMFPKGYYDPYMQNWSHDKGEACFVRTIDPALYGPNR